MVAKRALVTGITGQDGAYLAQFLLDKGYEVFGTFRRLSTPNFWRLQYLDVLDRVQLVSADLADQASLREAMVVANPDEVYHLAAQSFVGASFEQPVSTGQFTGLGVAHMLEVLREFPNARMYQASSSEMYGDSVAGPRNEDSPFHPRSPYAAAKLYGHWLTQMYAEAYGMFAVSGLLFNHESPLRGLEFVTRKITNAVAKIVVGEETELVLGNLDAQRDWGYAPDYVEAMWLMLQQDQPESLVVATGEPHSVREFAELAFDVAGIKSADHLKSDPKFVRPLDVASLQGDPAKARAKLGWQPRVGFAELVELMVKADVERWEKWLTGEHFPWDALSYPNEERVITRTRRL